MTDPDTLRADYCEKCGEIVPTGQSICAPCKMGLRDEIDGVRPDRTTLRAVAKAAREAADEAWELSASLHPMSSSKASFNACAATMSRLAYALESAAYGGKG